MRHLGRDGYMDLARSLKATTDRLLEGVAAIGDLAPLPDPEAGLLIITSTSLDLFAVSEALNRRGYPHGMTREPPGLHFTMNPLEDMRPVDGLLEAMREAVDDVRSGRVASSDADGSYI